MVASISFSGRECRHADEIFAFPARTEFSVTTGLFLGVREGRGGIPSLDQRCRKILRFHDAPARKTSDTSFESIIGDRLESPAKATSMVALRHCDTKESRAASD
jgi:hypothetical protein